MLRKTVTTCSTLQKIKAIQDNHLYLLGYGKSSTAVKPRSASSASVCTACISNFPEIQSASSSTQNYCFPNAFAYRGYCTKSYQGNKTTTEVKSNEEDSTREVEEVLDEKTQRQSTSTSAIPGSMSNEYVPFEDEQYIIQDVIEEQWNPLPPRVEAEPFTLPEECYKRGETGVFNLDELVDLIKQEKGMDICAIAIPKEVDYADHMLIVTARNPKQMRALATFIRKRFKIKHRKPTDVLPRIEGNMHSKDWLALDLGNIILHIFSKDAREYFDLETLWTVGYQYDDLFNQKDSEIVQLLLSIK